MLCLADSSGRIGPNYDGGPAVQTPGRKARTPAVKSIASGSFDSVWREVLVKLRSGWRPCGRQTELKNLNYSLRVPLYPLVIKRDKRKVGDVEQEVEAAGDDGGFDGAGGEIDDVVGLKERVGVFAHHDAFDVDVDEGARLVDGPDDA